MGGSGSGRPRRLVPGTKAAELALEAVAKRGITLDALAELLDIHPSSLHRILKDEEPNITLKTVGAFRELLKVPPDTWFEKPRSTTPATREK